MNADGKLLIDTALDTESLTKALDLAVSTANNMLKGEKLDFTGLISDAAALFGPKVKLGVDTGIAAIKLIGKAVDGVDEELRAAMDANAQDIADINARVADFDKVAQGAAKNVAGYFAQTGVVQALATELKSLVDETGRVSDANRERAETVLGQLNNALGTEFSLTDNNIQKNAELCTSIDNVILKMQAQAILTASQSQYEAAAANYGKALENYRKANEELDKLLKDQAYFQEQMDKGVRGEYVGLLQQMPEKIAGVEAKLKSAGDEVKIYEETMSTHMKLASAVAIGETDAMCDAIADYSASVKLGSDYVTLTETEKQKRCKETIDTILKDYDYFCTEYDKTGDNFYSTQATQAANALGGIVDEFVKAGGKISELEPMFKGKGVDITGAMGSGIEENLGSSIQPLTEMPETAVKDLSTKLQISGGASGLTATQVGKPLVNGMILGAISRSGALSDTLATIVKDAVDAAKEAGIIRSPSRLTRDEVGKPLVDGIAVGIIDNEYKVSDAIQNLFDNLDLELSVGAIDEAEYYRRLEFLRDEHIKAGTKQWWDYTKKLIDYEKKVAEEAEKAAEEAAKAAEEAAKETLEAFENGVEEQESLHERLFDLQKKLGTKSVQDEAANLNAKAARYREYAAEVLKLEGISDESRRELLNQYLTDAQDAYVEAFTLLRQEIEAQYDTLYGEHESFLNKLKDDAPLFLEGSITFSGLGEEDEVLDTIFLTDWEAQNQKLLEYAAMLDTLTDRVARYNDAVNDGVAPEDQFDYNALARMVRGMSISEGVKFSEALADLSEEEFASYLEGWRTNQQLSEQVAQDAFSDEFAALKRAGDELDAELLGAVESMDTQLKAWFGTLPATFFDSGSDAGLEFANGFYEAVSEALEGFSGLDFTDAGSAIGAAYERRAEAAVHQVSNTTYNFNAQVGGSAAAEIAGLKALEKRKQFAAI